MNRLIWRAAHTYVRGTIKMIRALCLSEEGKETGPGTSEQRLLYVTCEVDTGLETLLTVLTDLSEPCTQPMGYMLVGVSFATASILVSSHRLSSTFPSPSCGFRSHLPVLAPVHQSSAMPQSYLRCLPTSPHSSAVLGTYLP